MYTRYFEKFDINNFSAEDLSLEECEVILKMVTERRDFIAVAMHNRLSNNNESWKEGVSKALDDLLSVIKGRPAFDPKDSSTHVILVTVDLNIKDTVTMDNLSIYDTPTDSKYKKQIPFYMQGGKRTIKANKKKVDLLRQYGAFVDLKIL